MVYRKVDSSGVIMVQNENHNFDVSIILCTKNRASKLDACLSSIASTFSHCPEISSELIIINNGSTDNTEQYLADWIAIQPFSARYKTLYAGGLAAARNAAVALSRGHILAFTDDDCTVAPEYLRTVIASISKNGQCAIIGGRIELGDKRDLPITIKTSLQPSILRRGQTPGGFIMGANMMMARSLCSKLGPFDADFGAGGQFLSAEDTEYVFRAISSHFSIVYDPTVVVQHFHGRRDHSEIEKLEFGYCYGDGAMLAKHIRNNNLAKILVIKNIYWLIRSLFFGKKEIRKRSLFKFNSMKKGFFDYLNK